MSDASADISQLAGDSGKSIRSDGSSTQIREILLAAAWFGLVTGLVEGVGLWVLQQAYWLKGPFTFMGSSLEIVWISPVVNIILFGLLGLALSLLAWLLPRLPIVRIAVFLFAGLMFFDWTAMLLADRLAIWALPILALGLAVQVARWFHKRRDRVLSFWRTSTPWLGLAALLLVLGIQGGAYLRERIAIASLPEAAEDSPNILVILVDTLRSDHLSSYGYERPTSPNIDSLAQGGVQFDKAFAASSWTHPSHASLLTGRYPYEHGADAWKPLDTRCRTLGEELLARGYRTAGFSANYAVFNRRMGYGRGFNHFEDYYYSVANSVASTVYGRMFSAYGLHKLLGYEDAVDRRLASDVNESLLRWIDRDEGSPFFAFLNYFDVHDPYIPPQPFRSTFSELEEPGGLINTSWDMRHVYVPLSAEQLQNEVDAYDGAIAYVDDQIGQLLAELRERGLDGDTLVVVTSDHGESFGEHGLLHHGNSLYREVIQVPLILWWPGHVPAGEHATTPASNTALPATLLDLVGEGGETPFPGPSLAELWTSPEDMQDWPDPIAEIAQLTWVPEQHLPSHGAMRSVISDQWHYIEHETFGEELYDWYLDPEELVDLSLQEEYSREMDLLRMFLEGMMSSTETLGR